MDYGVAGHIELAVYIDYWLIIPCTGVVFVTCVASSHEHHHLPVHGIASYHEPAMYTNCFKTQ